MKNMTHSERAEIFEIETACFRLFLCHILFRSYFQVGLGVVQMVCYFKTSQSIRATVPLNEHFKSAMTCSKPTSHKTYHMYVHLFQGKKKKNILLAPLDIHFTSNVSRNVHGTTSLIFLYFSYTFHRATKMSIVEEILFFFFFCCSIKISMNENHEVWLVLLSTTEILVPWQPLVSTKHASRISKAKWYWSC